MATFKLCRYDGARECDFAPLRSPGYCPIHGWAHEATEEVRGCVASITCEAGAAGDRFCEHIPKSAQDAELQRARGKGKGVMEIVKRAHPNGPLTPQEKELRAQILQVRLYPGEKAEFRALCQRSNMEMSDVVRGLIKTLQAAADNDKLFCVHGQVCRLGLRMNEQLPLGQIKTTPGGG